jgi:hypothetical protein
MPGAASFSGGFGGGAKMRQNGECQGIRQCQQLVCALEVRPQVVNDDGSVKDATDLTELPSKNLLSIVQ